MGIPDPDETVGSRTHATVVHDPGGGTSTR